MTEPTISVIIPAYRAAGTIRRALDSVFAQTHLPDEVIVVDDGSPDDLANALQPFQDRVTLIPKTNGGAASARNLGIDRCRGDVIAFLDADDYWYPTKLERQVAILTAYPEVGLVAGWFHEEAPGAGRVDGALDAEY